MDNVIIEYRPSEKQDEYYLVLIAASNNEVLLVSENYANKGNGKRAADKLSRRIPHSLVREGKPEVDNPIKGAQA